VTGKTVLIVLLVQAVSACTTVAGSKGTPEALAGTVYYGTHATIGKCPSDEAESGILAAIGASIVAKGVSRIGAAIKAAANAETRQVVIRRNIELSNKQGLGPCLLLARGWFYEDRSRIGTRSYQKSEDSVFDYDSNFSSLHRQGLWLAATPDFFFEGKLIPSEDESALSLTPAYAYMGRPITSSWLRPGTARSILVAFAFTKPAKAADLSKGQGSTVVLGRFEANTKKNYSTDKVKLFTCDQAACSDNSAFAQRIRGPYESEWFSVPLTEKVQPLTLQALVSETRSASKFLGFVSEVFADVERDLATQLQQALVPSIGAAAEVSEQTAAENALNEFEGKYADALGKLAACTANGSDLTKISAAKAAMRTANQKARAANVAEPFTQAKIDAIELAPGTDAKPGCTAALNR
jgi:hypothetical protein